MASSSARRWFVTSASSGTSRALIEHALADGVITTVRNSRVIRNLESHFPGSLVEMLDIRDHGGGDIIQIVTTQPQKHGKAG
jgi:hypothetical protein